MDPAAPQKQRSPWLYVLLGCGGLAALICLGFTVFFLFIAKKGSDMVAGVTDPTVKAENAKKQLGGVPEGYSVIASLSIFGLMDRTLLADKVDGDGGLVEGARLFNYFHVIANEQNKKTKAFFTGDGDVAALRNSNVNLRAEDVLKKGSVTVDGRKIYYVSTRGVMDTGDTRTQGLNNAILFDCPGDGLSMGVWSQPDPNPQAKPEELDLAGTVADEAELAKFLKPIDPCGK
ncbi:MAG: hypothetical protein AB1938_14235 [Myxococcota bacterium]